MLLFDRFPGKARPKDECLATNNKTRLKFIPSSRCRSFYCSWIVHEFESTNFYFKFFRAYVLFVITIKKGIEN